MPVISIRAFGGISPKVPPRYLADTQAQVALNGPTLAGSLKPISDLSSAVHTLTKSGVPASIYRFGQGVQSDDQYWFSWASSVDVARGMVAGDITERTYFTGAGAYLRVTNNAMALAGGNTYPMASYRAGVPVPENAPICTVSGTGASGAIPESRVYLTTWVNSFGEESAPSQPSNSVTVLSGQTVTLSSLPAIPSGEWNLTHRRIYRSFEGEYKLVAEIAAATVTYDDAVAGDDLGEAIPSSDWDAPPDNLAGLVGLPNGILAGFVGNDVYLCEPYRPFAWPEKYINTVDYPVVGLGRMDTTLAVLTTGVPYFIQGTHPENMAVVRSDLEQACVSKRSIVSIGGAVIYASPDGLVALSSAGSKLLTSALFTRDQWQAFYPASIHAYAQDGQYIAFFDTGTAQGGFTLDIASGAFVMHDIYATAGYSDLMNDTLYLAMSNREVKKWGGGAAKSLAWKSKKFSMPKPVQLSCAQLEAESYPVTLKVYADSILLHTQTVTSRDAFRLPPMNARDWEFQIEGDKEVFSVAAATSMQELHDV